MKCLVFLIKTAQVIQVMYRLGGFVGYSTVFTKDMALHGVVRVLNLIKLSCFFKIRA